MGIINPLYVVAPSLEMYFVDKSTGLPLANGEVWFYQDTTNGRNILKPVYQISGGPGYYTYSVLPNPVILSGVGTFEDDEGNNVLPYYYPYDDEGNVQLYYIEVYDSNGALQFTREGWPNMANGPTPSGSVLSYNYVRNPQFYGWSYLAAGATGFGNVVQGGLIADDWKYSQDDPTQVINVTRGVFALGQTAVPGNPVYYLSYVNSNAGSAAGTFNYFIQTYNSVQTLSGQTVTFSVWLQGPAGAGISITLEQYFGTGGSPSTPVITPIIVNPASLSSKTWTQYSATVLIPSVTGKNIGSNGDDALALIINMPLNVTATVNIANVQMELGNQLSDFPNISNNDQYKATDTIVPQASFKTGDVKITLRTPADTGWLMMDDTTIGNNSSNANNVGTDVFNLFSIIWNNVNSNIWAPIYTSTGAVSTYGATALADWTANKQLSLTKALGRVLAGAGTGLINFIVTASSSGGLLITLPTGVNNVLLTGDPVTFYKTGTGVLPTGLAASTTYYVSQVLGNTYNIATTVANALAGTFIPYTDAGTAPFFISFVESTWVLGQIYGEQNHSILQEQLPVTNLNVNTTPYNASSGGATIYNPAAGGATPVAAVSSFGSSSPMNIMQPTTFMNVMIKL